MDEEQELTNRVYRNGFAAGIAYEKNRRIAARIVAAIGRGIRAAFFWSLP